jgi:hypothetical protein
VCCRRRRWVGHDEFRQAVHRLNLVVMDPTAKGGRAASSAVGLPEHRLALRDGGKTTGRCLRPKRRARAVARGTTGRACIKNGANGRRFLLPTKKRLVQALLKFEQEARSRPSTMLAAGGGWSAKAQRIAPTDCGKMFVTTSGSRGSTAVPKRGTRDAANRSMRRR